MASRASFLDLPHELLGEIIKYLDSNEIARCRSVCTTLNTVIDANAALLYRIELGIEGLVDGPSGGFCTSDRLKQLFERRNRWLALDWSHVLALKPHEIIPQTALPYELQGGIFLSVKNRSGQITINKTVLPTREDLDARHASHALQVKALDITADPTQDLLVMLDIYGRVNLWSLSTYSAHPHASQSVLRTEGPDNLFITALHIAHDLIALVEWAASVQVTIWNWKTGRTIIFGSGTSLPFVATGLAWLSPRVFVLSDATRGELVVFSLHNIDCISPSVSRFFSDLPPCARLQLPRVDNGWHMSHFQLETTPLLGELPRGSPFTAAPESHIVVFTMQYVTDNHRRTSSQYVGFVHSHYLRSCLNAQIEGESPSPTPWAEWGPKNVRIMPHCYPGPGFARFVHGQRVVYSRHHFLHRRHLLSVYDFNVHPRRVEAAMRAQGGVLLVQDEAELGYGPAARAGGPEAYIDVVDWPTMIPRNSQSGLQYHPFSEVVESALPYIETCRVVDGGVGRSVQFMMDEERLIEFNLSSREGPSDDVVRVYVL
ncbi:hypothetical protein BD414DRAFT_495635 [Trametes punicea]|nr:hypothetical protein BD414DRAFT_495635 [Trametes punicea]